MSSQAQLDHVVINVRYQMDQAEASFGKLGFALTERGYHSLGSINHLMMFGTDYAELIGLPADTQGKPTGRADIVNAPVGINGIVFKSEDIDATYAHLQSLDIAGDPPRSFSRPVTLPSATQDARFRTVAVRDGVFPGGRVYFCEHRTPELVWRPEWQTHRSGVHSIAEFVVACVEHGREAEGFSRLLDSPVTSVGDTHSVAFDGGKISIISPAAYSDRYGALASSMRERDAIFAALVFRTRTLDTVRDILTALPTPLPVINEAKRVVVHETTFNSTLEFIQ